MAAPEPMQSAPDPRPPPAPAPAPSPASRTPSRRLRWIAIALAALAIAIAALVVLAPAFVRRRVVAEARARGIALDPGDIEIRWGAVRLREARFSLVGVRGLAGAVATATVELDGLSPRRVRAEGLDIALAGFDVAPDLAGWAARRSARGADVPLSAAGARLSFRERDGAPEILAFDAAALDVAPGGGGEILGARLVLAGKEIARTDASWSVGGGGLAVGVGAKSPAGAPLRLELRPPPAAGVTVFVAVTPLSAVAALLAPFGGDAVAALAGVSASATVDVPLPARSPGAPVEGRVELTLGGWVPPHPKELDGILFGTTTTVKGGFRYDPAARRLALRDLAVAAGALKLAGSGAVQIEPADAAIDVDLAGSIPCTLLTRSAALAHLGPAVGALAGDLLARALAGAVAVRVRIDARASRLAAARIDRSASVGCRIRL